MKLSEDEWVCGMEELQEIVALFFLLVEEELMTDFLKVWSGKIR